MIKPFSHVFVIVLENRAYSSVIGDPNMPELNELADAYSLAVNYQGVAHPSLPNYIAMISGHTWDSRSDAPAQRFPGETLAHQMVAKGLTWKAYMESMPTPGYDGDYAGSPVAYARRHNPFMLFPSIIKDKAMTNRVVPYSQFKADLKSEAIPHLSFISPNMCHDMHGTPACSNWTANARIGDHFTGGLVKRITASSTWDPDAVIFITFDEGIRDGKDIPMGPHAALYQGGHVATIVIGGGKVHARRSQRLYNHYSLLRTLEEAWDLPLLGHASDVQAMDDLVGNV